MTAIGTILKAQQRRWHVRVLASTLAFILIALGAYLVLLGQGPMALSPRQVIDVLTGGGSKNGWLTYCFIHDGSSCCLCFADFLQLEAMLFVCEHGGYADLTWWTCCLL